MGTVSPRSGARPSKAVIAAASLCFPGAGRPFSILGLDPLFANEFTSSQIRAFDKGASGYLSYCPRGRAGHFSLAIMAFFLNNNNNKIF